MVVAIQGAGDSARMQVSAVDVLWKELAKLEARLPWPTLSNGPVRNVVFEVHPQYGLTPELVQWCNGVTW